MKSGDAFNSQLYRQRDVETGTKVRVRGQEVSLTQKAVDEALKSDGTSKESWARSLKLMRVSVLELD